MEEIVDTTITSSQKELGVDYNLFQVQGFIRNLLVTPREGKDSVYKFQLRYIDKDNKLQEPETWYSGFKETPGQNGDYLIFKYKVSGIYKNVKEIIDIKYTHDDPTQSDHEAIEEIKKDIDNPKIQSNLEGQSATVSNKLPLNELSQPYRTLLLNGTIHLCIRRGTLTEDEIIAQYGRFLKIL